MEVFINCSESKEKTSLGETSSGSMKLTWCSDAKSAVVYDLQKVFITTKDMESLLR
jgi:hypothetical protein